MIVQILSNALTIKQLANIPNARLAMSNGMTFEQLEKVYPNLTTTEERKQQLEIIINDKSGVVKEMKLDGKTYGAGLPAYTGSTSGVPSF